MMKNADHQTVVNRPNGGPLPRWGRGPLAIGSTGCVRDYFDHLDAPITESGVESSVACARLAEEHAASIAWGFVLAVLEDARGDWIDQDVLLSAMARFILLGLRRRFMTSAPRPERDPMIHHRPRDIVDRGVAIAIEELNAAFDSCARGMDHSSEGIAALEGAIERATPDRRRGE